MAITTRFAIILVQFWFVCGTCFAEDIVVPMGYAIGGETVTEIDFGVVSAGGDTMRPVFIRLDDSEELSRCVVHAEVTPDAAVGRFSFDLNHIVCADENSQWIAEGRVRGYVVEGGEVQLGVPFPPRPDTGFLLPRKTKLGVVFQETGRLVKRLRPGALVSDDIELTMGLAMEGVTTLPIVGDAGSVSTSLWPVAIVLRENLEGASCTVRGDALYDAETARFHIRLNQIFCCNAGAQWVAEGSVWGFAVEKRSRILGIPATVNALGEISVPQKTRLEVLFAETYRLRKRPMTDA